MLPKTQNKISAWYAFSISNVMPSRSKIKGSTWEREVARFLTETYEQPFVRVTNSGAYIGGSNYFRKQSLDAAQAKAHRGDINPPDSWLRFNAEAKNYDDLALHQLFSGACTKLEEWIEQLLAVSEPGDLDVLFIKLTRKCRLVCVRDLDWMLHNYAVYNSVEHGTWVISDFDDFFKLNKSKFKHLSTAETISNNQHQISNI